MCGIVGYLGRRSPVSVIVESLEKLEYRGYDSSGVAAYTPGRPEMMLSKAEGKLANLKAKLNGSLLDSSQEISETILTGIGHIRWATHGGPTDRNAHPHRSDDGLVTLVHNGIFENFSVLRTRLEAKGIVFQSDTDTESAAHLIEEVAKEYPADKFITAFKEALIQLEGAYALCLMHKEHPGKLYVARHQAPLVIGLGEGELFVASDTVALAPWTKRFIFLADGEFAELNEDGTVHVFDKNGAEVEAKIETLHLEALTIDKRGFKHFMLKEIHEQPDVVRNSLYGRLVTPQEPIALFAEATKTAALLADITRVVIIGCGTSYNAGLVGKYFLESAVRLPVEVEAAGEFRYREPVIDEHTLVVAISQSGETADTLEALRQSSQMGAKTLVITNREESSMGREVDFVLPVRAGVEVSVCATKSFTAQLIALYLLGLAMAEQRQTLTPEQLLTIKQELNRVPTLLEQILSSTTPQIKDLAKDYGLARDILFIARGINFPSAMEGALKLKEISYIHAEGYSGAELKHGPIALLDPTVPVVAVLAPGVVYDKMISNCQEVKARASKLLGIHSVDTRIDNAPQLPEGLFDDIITIPATHEWLSPLLTAVPMQLLSYYMAEYLGKDVDQPRNLAKSVTVE